MSTIDVHAYVIFVRVDQLHVSDNNRSYAYMVIYWGEWVNVPIRLNGAGTGICVRTINRPVHRHFQCQNDLERVSLDTLLIQCPI